MSQGVFYGVSVGPGEPELITIQALKRLRACPVIAAPQTPNGRMRALEIISGVLDLRDKLVIPLPFSMTMDEEIRAREYGIAADIVAKQLQNGFDVAMPNIGDVSIFATYPYLAQILQKRGYKTVMLSGVTSFSAAAARLGISLTERDTSMTIFPGHERVEEGLAIPGTKVFMKSGRNTQDLLRLLGKRGLSEKSCMVINCGQADEMLFHTLRDIPEDFEPGYFSLVIVKE